MSEAEDIESKAAEWLIRRDATPTEDNRELTAWLSADPRHRAAYLRLAAAWERTVALKRLAPEGRAIDADLLAPKPTSRFPPWIPWALAAGLAAVILAGGWWFTENRGIETYRTEVGGLSRVVLADGSTVTLNTDTELKVRLLPRLREITLLNGEAQFAVAHDPNRPFEVFAAGRRVRAVGTAFDVRLSPDEGVLVIVTEGRVAVGNAADSGSGAGELAPAATVSAGASAVARAGNVTVRHVTPAEASRQLAWEAGQLSFQGETLKQAVAEFNRYNHRKLQIDDPTIEDFEIGGNFQALDEESFVAALSHSFGITAKASVDGAIVLQGSAERHR